MDNLLEKYLLDKNITVSRFSEMMKCSYGAVYKWATGRGKPRAPLAWRMHKLTRAEVPITYWGFIIINGKLKKLDDL